MLGILGESPVPSQVLGEPVTDPNRVHSARVLRRAQVLRLCKAAVGDDDVGFRPGRWRGGTFVDCWALTRPLWRSDRHRLVRTAVAQSHVCA